MNKMLFFNRGQIAKGFCRTRAISAALPLEAARRNRRAPLYSRGLQRTISDQISAKSGMAELLTIQQIFPAHF